MTESQPFRPPEPDARLKTAAAQELKRCWLTKIGSRSDVRGIVVDDSGALNNELLKSLINLQALISHCLQDPSLNLHEPAILYIPLLEIHPQALKLEHAGCENRRALDSLSREEKVWAIGVLIRILKDYPKGSYGNRTETGWKVGRARYVGYMLDINPDQLYDSEHPKDSSRNLNGFLTTYVGYLTEQLTDPDTRDRVIDAAQAKMQELAARKPTDRALVTPLRPGVGAADELIDRDAESDDGPTESQRDRPTSSAGAPASVPLPPSGGKGVGQWAKGYWKPLTGAAAAAALVIGVTTIMVFDDGNADDHGTFAGATSSVSSTSINSLFPLSPNTPCHSPEATTVQLPDVEICVAYWCVGRFHAPDGVNWIEGRGQIKLRPRIINNSAHAIDISITAMSALRLLVATPLDPATWWMPPPITASAGDRPIKLSFEGQTYWAVPPNAPRDAVQIDLPNNMYTYDGFATSWYDTELGPGQTAFKPLRKDADGRPIQEGNLVFNVPVATQDVGLKGLVLVDRNDPTTVLAFIDKEKWPAPADLNSF
ncbi:hypothetical protein H0264_35645 [Nocardia huaxiensis]|uniref:Uncharacterized protein n=1 Tax=Nocardia huaxiensis TaxID=2755382 RepID=A0A7D6ZI97_9NOCA|nr:hypothetical protein [Nocardia huaxiensis]QLY30400.1 hypothetical protein H0264_35645 [Nocardia huaxiensis]